MANYYGDDNDNILNGSEDNDYIDGKGGNDTLNGLGGDDFIEHGDGDDLLLGGAGNDVLQGGNGNDTLIGGLGDDFALQGNGGADTYIFAINDGHDEIFNDDFASIDVVKFTDVASTDISNISRLSHALLLNYGSNDQLTISYYFSGGGDRIDQFQFGDGVTWSWADIKPKVLKPTDGNDQLSGYDDENDKLSGLAGNDTISGAAGNDTLNGGIGNDSLEGGVGDDTYLIAKNDGKDIIYETKTGGDVDVVIFTDVASTDISNTRRFGDALLLDYGSNSRLTVKNYFSGEGYRIDPFQFSDGVTWGWADIKPKVLKPTGGDDLLSGYDDENDSLSGLAGNDTIYGGAGNDTLNGGPGNDRLEGGTGGDTYVIANGDGKDAITDDDDDSNNIDVLLFTDVASTDISTISRLIVSTVAKYLNDDLLLNYGSNAQLTISRYFYSDGNRVEQFQFSDGVTWGWADIKPKLLNSTNGDDFIIGYDDENDNLSGLAGHDTIIGGAGDDTLNGGLGSDQLQGEAGADLILGHAGTDILYGGYGFYGEGEFLSDYGNDTLSGGLGDDRLYGDGGDDRLLGVEGADILDAGDGNDMLNGGTGDDRLLGGNGDNVLLGGAGADTLFGGFGGAGNDTLNGGLGDDYMRGNNGDDTYLIAKNDGHDTIDLTDKTSGVDTVKFTDVALIDITAISRSGNYLLIDSGNSDRLTLQYFFGAPAKIGQFQFADGGLLTHFVIGSAADNMLTGTAANDALMGLAGYDSLSGGAGDDLYRVDNTGDNVFEGVNAGQDTVLSSVNFRLATNVENLALLAGALTATGNELDNTLTGNDAANILIGLTGNDTLNGNNGDDKLFGGIGYDTLNGGIGADTLNGGGLYDVLIGGPGKDNIVLTELFAARDTVKVAAGESVVEAFDTVTGFTLGKGRFNREEDLLDLDSTAIAVNVAAADGMNAGLIKSHAISNGIISFDDADSYVSALILEPANLSDVFQYLQSNINSSETVAVKALGNTYVFQDGAATDTLVQLTGVLADNLFVSGQGLVHGVHIA